MLISMSWLVKNNILFVFYIYTSKYTFFQKVTILAAILDFDMF